jgi:hypothetical protein
MGMRNLVRGSDPVAPTWAAEGCALAAEPTEGAFAYTGAASPGR